MPVYLVAWYHKMGCLSYGPMKSPLEFPTKLQIPKYMIESLHLRNFQCHEELALELAQLTVLIGDNAAGKTAILRALRWLVLNEWSGRAGQQIRWGQESCSVAAVVDGHRIERSKSKEDNLYVLDGQEFRAFHKNVPAPIQQLLRLSVDNFQQQHDPAFWLSLTSGQAASALNEIFHLSEIDEALATIASELRQARARVQISEERLAEAKSQRSALAWVKEAARDWAMVESSITKIEDTRERLEELERLHEQQRQLRRRLKQLRAVLVLGEQALQLATSLLEVRQRLEMLEAIQSQEVALRKQRQELHKKEQLLEKWLKECPLCGRGE